MTQTHNTLIDISIPATLDALVSQYSTPEYNGASVELWTFDSPERRAAAQKTLQDYGVNAHIRSAYKPLVHVFLEELDLTDVSDIVVHYPIIEGVPENRFRLECYPVRELVGTLNLTFSPLAIKFSDQLINYRVELIKRKDSIRKKTQIIDIAAPNHFTDTSCGEHVLTNTGWCRVFVPAKPALSCNKPYSTDMERAFSTVMTTLKNHAWPKTAPYFERMIIRIEAPFCDYRLPLETEFISTAEAMHEDIYFSALEVFKNRNGLKKLDRSFQPGQIVPEIIISEGPTRVIITTCADDANIDIEQTDTPIALVDLAKVEHWLEPNTIKAHLDALGGAPYKTMSQRGRPVWGTHIKGRSPSMVVTAGQHANETSGPVGALRAAEQLVTADTIGFTISPLDNPDGYALFRQLCTHHPHHMHHASRYTAGGGDLEFLDHEFENKIRHMGREKTNSEVHISLHGYPAHEWTRPFTGYIPQGFDLWTIPKGFFLILRYWAGWEDRANAVLNKIIEELATYQPIVDLNRTQLARYKHYVPEFAFEVRNNFPVFASEVNEGLFPITIITEAPDETVYGEEFIVAHTAQMKTVLGAAIALTVITHPLAMRDNV